ncbi:MAG: hypothetical protein ACFB02_07690 [Mastigocoleus sp.]
MLNQFQVRLSRLFLGGCLAIFPHLLPAQAQQLPELPPVYVNDDFGNINSLPPVQTNNQEYTTTNPSSINLPTNPPTNPSSNSFNPPDPGYQTAQSSPYSQGYLVYVNSNNRQTLEQVRQLESGAFIQQFTDGRSVIQAGLFNQMTNAQQFWQQLVSYGLNEARIVDLTSGQEYYYDPNSNPNPIDNTSNPNTPSNDRFAGAGGNGVSSKAYYVAIPTQSSNLNQLQNRIQALVGGSNVAVRARNVPKGSHVSVGPFQRHSVAKQWNNYLKGEGLKNSRIYYGK